MYINNNKKKLFQYCHTTQVIALIYILYNKNKIYSYFIKIRKIVCMSYVYDAKLEYYIFYNF